MNWRGWSHSYKRWSDSNRFTPNNMSLPEAQRNTHPSLRPPMSVDGQSLPALEGEVESTSEVRFWNGEPRYSVTSLRPGPSRAPAAPPPAPHPLAVAAFAVVFSGVLALLAFEGYLTFVR